MAVVPPAELLDALEALPRPEVAGLRWTTRPQWHVTLRFLGQVVEVGPVLDALEAVAPTAAPTEARLGPEVARFGDRILHVPVDGLAPLAGDVVRATATLGQAPEDRPFHGHITLARASRHGGARLARLTGAPVAGRWQPGELCLVVSHPGRGGSRYEVVRALPLPQG